MPRRRRASLSALSGHFGRKLEVVGRCHPEPDWYSEAASADGSLCHSGDTACEALCRVPFPMRPGSSAFRGAGGAFDDAARLLGDGGDWSGVSGASACGRLAYRERWLAENCGCLGVLFSIVGWRNRYGITHSLT